MHSFLFFELQHFDPRNFELQKFDPRNFDLQNSDSRNFDPRNVDLQNFDLQILTFKIYAPSPALHFLSEAWGAERGNSTFLARPPRPRSESGSPRGALPL